jgi:hypothetical protein
MIGSDSCARHKPDPFPVTMALDELGYEALISCFRRRSRRTHRSEMPRRVNDACALGPSRSRSSRFTNPRLYLERITDLPRTIQRLQAGAIAGRTPRDGTMVEKPY